MLIYFYFLLSIPWGNGTVIFGNIVQVNDYDSLKTAQNHPEVIIDDFLRIYVAWQDDRDQDGNYEIYYAKSLDSGKTFSQDINLSQSPSVNDKNPQMVLLGSNIYVVWQSLVGTVWNVYYTHSTNGGNSFSSPTQIPGITITNSTTSNINDGPRPHIAGCVKNDSTFLYLVWSDDATGILRVKLARSINGNDFQDMGFVDHNASRVNRHSSIVLDNKGRLLIVWAYGTSGTSQDPHPLIAFNKSTDRGETFFDDDSIVVDNPLDEVYRGNPSITFTKMDSTIIITWEDCRRQGGNEYPDIYFTRSRDGGQSFLKPNLRVNWIQDTAKLYNNYRAKVAMDPEGRMAVSWHSDPEKDGNFGIYMCAYDDSIGKFGMSKPISIDTMETFTGYNPGSFGNNFYPLGLRVADVNGTTNFFMVWKDMNYDTLGNIYFVRGKVLVSHVDFDIYNDALDVVNNIIDFDSLPAGPAYVSKYLQVVNTSDSENPDTTDGPSSTNTDSIYLESCSLINSGGDTLGTPFLEYVPSSLSMGEKDSVKLTLFIPEGKLKGDYMGFLKISSVGQDSTFDTDSVLVVVRGPYPEETLDSLKVFPNPFRPDLGHSVINFEGLTQDATVVIYDLKGRKIFREREDNADGLITWRGNVASGVYLYIVKNKQGECRKGKIAIIK